MISVRRKLLLWLLLGQVLAIVVTGAISFFYVRNQVENLFDDRLRQLAYSIPVSASILPTAPPRNSSAFDDEDGDDFIIQIWDTQGTLLSQLNRDEGRPQRAKIGFSTQFSDDKLWRTFVLQRDQYQVQISQPFADRLEMSLRISLGATAPILVLIILLGGLVWLAVRRSLAPLTALADSVRQRNPYSLTPIALDNLPQEVVPLVEALNHLLISLQHTLEGQRKFTADAAHELRTPLTAVHLQVQLLKKCQDQKQRKELINQLNEGVIRSGHLVQQLLALARMEPDRWERPFAKIDLLRLLRTVVADLTPASLARDIDLGIKDSTPLQVNGDAESLRVLFNNLVDNAIRYSFPHGRVDISLAQTRQMGQVVVQDQGPGIPPKDRQLVFNRFYRRADTGTSGSGLGLAIVQEIVKNHQGTIVLADRDSGSGLKVIVALPLSPLD